MYYGVEGKAQFSEEWDFVRPIDIIHRDTVDTTNYQVKLILNTEELIDAGKMEPSGSDIRFSSDCYGAVDTLPYFIEKNFNSDSTIIWVKTNTLQIGFNRFYMFYGNQSAFAGDGSNFGLTFPNAKFFASAADVSGENNTFIYDWIEIEEGFTLDVTKLTGGLMNSVATFRARKVIVRGNINGNATGEYTGLCPGAPGGQFGLGGPGGGGHGGNGGDGAYATDPATAGPGGPICGFDNDMTAEAGSGGAQVIAFLGGRGGAAVIIDACDIEISQNSQITMNGQAGPAGSALTVGGGGGAGGEVVAIGQYLIAPAVFEANGGAGGNGSLAGGGGGAGRIQLYSEFEFTGGSYSLLGGKAGVSSSNANGLAQDGQEATPFIQTDFETNHPLFSFGNEAQTSPQLITDKVISQLCSYDSLFAFTIESYGDGVGYWRNNTLEGTNPEPLDTNTYFYKNLMNQDSIYMFTFLNDPNQVCEYYSDTFELIVTPDPYPNYQADTIITCFNSDTILLPKLDPEVVFVGDGIIDQQNGIFDPRLSDTGVQEVIMELDVANCTYQYSVFIHVRRPNTEITSPAFYCFEEGIVQLQANEDSGFWSGRGIIDDSIGLFDPSILVNFGNQSTIQYTIQDSIGCTTSSQQFIQVNPLFRPTADSLCNNILLRITSNLSGGIWSGTANIDSILGTYQTSKALNDTLEILYTIDAFEYCSNDSTDTTSYQIQIPLVEAPIAFAGLDSTICQNSFIELGGAPTASHPTQPITRIQWSPSLGLENDTISNPTARTNLSTNYIVEVESENGCFDVDTVLVTVIPDRIQVDAGKDSALCAAGVIALGGNPTLVSGNSTSATYFWTNPNVSDQSIANPTINVSDTFSSRVIVTAESVNGNICYTDDEIKITVAPPFNIILKDTILCVNSPFEYDGNNAVPDSLKNELSYKWLPEAIFSTTSDSIVGQGFTNSPFVGTLTVTNAKGCAASSSFFANVVERPQLEVDIDTFGGCSGLDVDINPLPKVSAGSPPYSFYYTPGSVFADSNNFETTFNIDSIQTIELIVLDQLGCLDTAEVVLNVLPSAILNLGDRIEACFGEIIQLGEDQIVTSGTPPFNFQWLPNIALDDNNSPNPQFLADSSRVFTLFVEDGKGCVSSDSLVAVVSAKSTIELNLLEDIYCPVDTSINLFANYGPGIFDGRGIVNDGLRVVARNPIATKPIPDNRNPGLFELIQVNFPGGGILGNQARLDYVYVEIEHERVGDLEIAVQAPNGEIITLLERPGLPKNIPFGCESADLQIQFIDNAQDLFEAEDVCYYGGTGITGKFLPVEQFQELDGSSVNGQWRIFIVDNAQGKTGKLIEAELGFSGKAEFNPISAGIGKHTISYTFIDRFGCENQQNFEVEVASLPLAEAGPISKVCDGDTIQIGGFPSVSGGTPPFTFMWTGDNIVNDTIANPSIHPSETQTYYLEVRDINECKNTQDSVLVIVDDSPEGSINITPLSTTEILVESSSTQNSDDFTWYFGDGAEGYQRNMQHRYSAPGVYNVCLEITNIQDCKVELCETVDLVSVGINKLENTKIAVYPNPASGNQDVLTIESNEEILSVRILNLNGQTIQPQMISISNSTYQYQIQELPNSVYVILVSTSNGVFRTNWIKQ